MDQLILAEMLRKKRTYSLVDGVQIGLKDLGFDQEMRKKILALVLIEFNAFLEGDGLKRLPISGIPVKPLDTPSEITPNQSSS